MKFSKTRTKQGFRAKTALIQSSLKVSAKFNFSDLQTAEKPAEQLKCDTADFNPCVHCLKEHKLHCHSVPEAEHPQPLVPPVSLSSFVRDPDETGHQSQTCPEAEPTTEQHTVSLSATLIC